MTRLGLRLHADEEHWIPLSDLMTGLMFLFLLIALAYMVEVKFQQAQTQRVAVIYTQTRRHLYEDLSREFHADLQHWGADIDPNTLSIRFYAPAVLFANGSSELRPRFKAILDDFFPRYIRILSQPQYRDIISEIRVEGYTSTGWRPGASIDESYIGNMALSQDRTRSVLSYVLPMAAIASQKSWLMGVLTANGLSFSHLRVAANGKEDPYASQRVEFRVRTDGDEQIRKVLALSQAPNAVASAAAPAATPAYPAWSVSLIGKPLQRAFPEQSSDCIGYLDDVTPVAGTDEATLRGWAYDTKGHAPVAHVVLVDARGTIIGAGEGGHQRLDVPSVHPEIRTAATGWLGYAGASSRSIEAWAVVGPSRVCRLIGLGL